MPEVSIVIPVFNEGENIARCLLLIQEQVQVDYRISVVYDFDADTTVPVVKRIIETTQIPVQLVKNDLGRGVINAIKKGLQTAEGEFVVVTMADLSDPPAVINQMLSLAKEKGLDLVCGSRYMRGGRQIGGPLLKRTLSRLAGVSLYYLTNLPTHDVTNSFKLYRQSVLKQFPLESQGGFEVGMELVVKAHFNGFKVGEVPTHWQDRVAGESNFKLFAWLPNYLKWYFYSLRKHWLG